MSTISASTTTTTAYKVTADTTGTLVLQTGSTPTTAVTIGSDQSVTFAGAVSLSGNQTTTGNLTVNGNTTLGDASTDTVLITGAPSIGGAGLGMGMGFRNRIINGAMVIDQRNAGASVAITTSNQYTLDRWQAFNTQASKFSVQQNAGSVTPPSGFSKYYGATSSSAYSVLTGDIFGIVQVIEGFNMADLAWGTANAQAITLSFRVYSSLTGTFGGSITNGALNYSYPFTYSIPTANTWTTITVTVAGPTAGTWAGAVNTAGIYLIFGLGGGATVSGTAGSWASASYYTATGATSVVGTNGATFYITGVQLEKGSTATSFDYRPYGTELALCQRYLPAISYSGGSNPILGAGMPYSTTAGYYTLSFPVTPRVPPTGLIVSAASHFSGMLNTTGTSACTGIAFVGASNHSVGVNLTGMTGLVVGNSSFIFINNPSALLYFTGSEL